MSASVLIRIARLSDAATFVEHRLELFRADGQLPVDADVDELVRDTHAAFVEDVEQGTSVIWFAESSGAPVGSTVLTFRPRIPSVKNPLRREAYLAHMFVHADLRRRGVGSMLLRTAIEEARGRGHLRMLVHATAAGGELYERFGFRRRTTEMELTFAR